MQKYYLVPAEIMESNFPDEFGNGTYPGSLLSQPIEGDDLESLIVIPKKEYDGLLDDENKLNCLEGAGVDNWQGYDDAMELFRQSKEG